MTQGMAQTTVSHALANARRLLLLHPGAAARQAEEIIRVEPGIAETHLILAAAMRRLGKMDQASLAEQEGIRRSAEDPVNQQASRYIAQGRIERAEDLLSQTLKDTPQDPEALRLSAGISRTSGRHAKAEYLLRRCLRTAPGFTRARQDLNELVEAEGSLASPELEEQSGEQEFALAIRLNEEGLAKRPDDPNVWLSYGHVLRMAGRSEDSINAYRKAIDIKPSFGEAWWSIADLKTVKFTDADIQAMTHALSSGGATNRELAGIHFALGKALGDIGNFEDSFAHYAAGNQLRAGEVAFDPDELDDFVDRARQLFSKDFFKERKGQGAEESDPIFIVGLHRSGSTLLEQMLTCHTQIEPTDELIEINRIGNFLAGNEDIHNEIPDYLDALKKLGANKLRSTGMSYLINSLPQRKFGKGFFIDKAPPNWLHVGLIHLILPNAKIIDIRRNPMACGFSNYVQNYAIGRGFSYDLGSIARYYRAYVRMMAHFDDVLPGRVHHIHYEDLIQNPEQELRKVFAYLKLPFEEACLKFHESKRAVKTSSSEQVRRPLTDAGMKQWQPYAKWLGPLREALGSVQDCYPEVPADLKQSDAVRNG